MKESICNQKICEKQYKDRCDELINKLEPYIKKLYLYNIDILHISGVYWVWSLFRGDVAIINIEKKTIMVNKEKHYDGLKRFGEDNGYKELIKCWDGVV